MEWMWMWLVNVLVVCKQHQLVLCAPASTAAPSTQEQEIVFAREFMSRFGYLEEGGAGGGGVGGAESLVQVEQAIRDVQRFGGIDQTGRLDNDTLQLMRSRRCGLPDTQISQNRVLVRNKRRGKRYILGPTPPWSKRLITYFISNWTPKIGLEAVRREIRRALDAWARYAGLKFREVNSADADIIVAFGTGFHGDPYPFDGPGSTLAHAFFPGEEGSFGGDVHFDDDEPWRINPGEFEEGVDFFTVAVHEIGHSLGLSHSPEQGSVMNPYYRRLDDQGFNLGYDDIRAMYELYITNPGTRDNSWDVEDNQPDYGGRGRPKPTTPRTTPRPTWRTTPWVPRVTYVGDDESVEVHKSHDRKHGVPGPAEPLTPPPPSPTTPIPSSTSDACTGHFSAVAHLRGELFIFKDNMMWRLSAPGRVASGYPVPLHRMFNNLPQSVQRIDAAYERNTDSNIVFFSGDKYWLHNGNDVVAGSPRSIYDYGLPHYVKNIDAIMVWDKNKKTYIFSGEKYWRFNETSHSMDPGYPKSIQRFREVPANLDSAMTWSDGITYFFKDNLYWAFNNTWLKAERFYPQQASQYWLACR